MATTKNMYHFGLTYRGLENLCPGIAVNPRNIRKNLDYSDMIGSGDIVTPLLICKLPDGSFYPAKGNRRLSYWRNTPDILGSVIINDLSLMEQAEAEKELDRLGADHGQEVGLDKAELFGEYRRLASLGYTDDDICKRLRHALMAASGDWLTIRTAFLKKKPDASPAALMERFRDAQRGTLQVLRGLYNLPTAEQSIALSVWGKTGDSPDGLTVKEYATIGNDLAAIRKAGFDKSKLETGKGLSQERGDARKAAVEAALEEAEEEGRIMKAVDALKSAAIAKKPKKEDKELKKVQQAAFEWFVGETFDNKILGTLQRLFKGDLAESESDKLRLEVLSYKD